MEHEGKASFPFVSGKNKYDFWKIIFQTGKTSDGTQVLVVPLNVADMIKK
jgi:hypothetical protein